jgi:hypothetical protein
MSLFKSQKLICCICGKDFLSDFRTYGGSCCSSSCKEEYEWRKTLYIMGEDYHKKIFISGDKNL